MDWADFTGVERVFLHQENEIENVVGFRKMPLVLCNVRHSVLHRLLYKRIIYYFIPATVLLELVRSFVAVFQKGFCLSYYYSLQVMRTHT